MRIIVCIKQVPDTNEVRINKETGTLIRDGVPTIINPDDKSAIELALKIKDEKPETYVGILTMGPKQAENALKEALCMGADEAFLLTDRKFAGADTWSTSIALAAAIEKIGADIILCGRQAIDGDTAQVGPQIAQHMQIPQATYVSEMNIQDDSVTVTRQFEDGFYKLELKTPCLLTALSEEIEPRYMNTKYIVKTCTEPKISILTVDDITVDEKELGLKGSPTRVKKTMTKGSKTEGIIYNEEPEEGIKQIVAFIDALKVL